MHQVLYINIQGHGGLFGSLNKYVPNSVCGHISHVDENLDILWWNGGLKIFKGSLIPVFTDFTHYSLFDNENKNETWIENNKCSLSQTHEIKSISDSQIILSKDMIKLYHELFFIKKSET